MIDLTLGFLTHSIHIRITNVWRVYIRSSQLCRAKVWYEKASTAPHSGLSWKSQLNPTTAVIHQKLKKMSSGLVSLTKDDANLVGISIGGGAPLCPHVYIVQVFDNTPASLDRTLESGDRIVAVNNADVMGRTKLEVARMIQNAGVSFHGYLFNSMLIAHWIFFYFLENCQYSIWKVGLWYWG